MKQNKIESGQLFSSGFSNGVKAAIPFVRICGAQKGPALAVVAAQHGRELNGIESIRQAILHLRGDLSLRGSCTFIPVANPLGCQMRKQDFPFEDRRLFAAAPHFNMNRGWPGREDGELYERIEKVIWDNAISQANICIDLHCWSDRSAMLVWGPEKHADLVKAFGLPIYYLEKNGSGGRQWLRDACYDAGIAAVTAELTPQHTISQVAVEAGKRGILNIMKQAGMLEGKIELPPVQFEFYKEFKEHAIKAEQAGLLVSRMKVNSPVRKDEIIAEIVDLNDVLQSQLVRSPVDGVLYNNGPVWSGTIPYSDVVSKGETVALVRETKKIINEEV